MHAFIYVCMYVCMYVCFYVHLYVYVYLYARINCPLSGWQDGGYGESKEPTVSPEAVHALMGKDLIIVAFTTHTHTLTIFYQYTHTLPNPHAHTTHKPMHRYVCPCSGLSYVRFQ